MIITLKNRVNYKMNARELAEFATERYALAAVKTVAKELKSHYLTIALKSLELMQMEESGSVNYNGIKDLFNELRKLSGGDEYNVRLEEEYPEVDFDCPTSEDEETYAPELWKEIRRDSAFPTAYTVDDAICGEMKVDAALQQLEGVFSSFDTLHNRLVRVKDEDEDAAREEYCKWLQEESLLTDEIHDAVQPIVEAYRRDRDNLEFPKDAEDSFREAYISE
ncbi:MAG: hypothetical protein LUC33_05595 [Prevotellaceae bacterium]|nr:hypothetical protein [Prevotellaceae bacterium]